MEYWWTDLHFYLIWYSLPIYIPIVTSYINQLCHDFMGYNLPRDIISFYLFIVIVEELLYCEYNIHKSSCQLSVAALMPSITSMIWLRVILYGIHLSNDFLFCMNIRLLMMRRYIAVSCCIWNCRKTVYFDRILQWLRLMGVFTPGQWNGWYCCLPDSWWLL